MAKIHRKIVKHFLGLNKELAREMLKLATSGFRLVAALAWNELIKEVVKGFIEPLLGGISGMVSLLIYAVLVTSLAVLITYNLSRIVRK